MNSQKSFLIDMTGQRIGRLVVLERDLSRGKRPTMWKCKCDCGNIISAQGSGLRNGHTKSCGCYGREKLLQNNTKHNLSNHRLYRIWAQMKDRCYNPKSHNYKHYGGRGIAVCDEWKNSFESFYSWSISSGYKDDAPRGLYTLDRIDVNGNYCPENCRYTDTKEQSLNKRTTHYLTLNGETKPITVWANEIGVHPTTIDSRIRKHGWSVEKALTTPPYNCGRRIKDGNTK